MSRPVTGFEDEHKEAHRLLARNGFQLGEVNDLYVTYESLHWQRIEVGVTHREGWFGPGSPADSFTAVFHERLDRPY